MAKSLISVEVSQQVVNFTPGGSPASFELTVHNDSDKFATFQVAVLAAGADSDVETDQGKPVRRWYSLTPEVCAKTPPGASTQFVVVIKDTPKPGFVGNMDLSVRIFSLELQDDRREIVRLVLQAAKGLIPVQVELPVRRLQVKPEERVEVPVRVYNPGQHYTEVSLSLLGVDPSWLVAGAERRLKLKPAGRVETSFLCQLPITTQTVAQEYPFTVTATQEKGLPSQTEGVLEVIRQGWVDFSCTPALQEIPESRGWLPKWKSNSATYSIKFDNQSNLIQQVGIEVKKIEEPQKSTLQVMPDTADLKPGETTELLLVATTRRRWFGLARKLLFEVKAVVSDQRLDVRNDTQLLKLRVLPILEPWMQLVLLLLLLLLLWSFSCYNPANSACGHQAAVNTVQFNGLADQAVSGSNDQTIRRWRVSGFFNPLILSDIGVLGHTGKAVRVVRYRPVDNNLVAAGLENGEIQLWNLMGDGKKPIDSLSYQKDDRVLDLAFTKDSRYLFSGHGSGLVLLWDIARNLPATDNAIKPIRQKQVDFAIYSMALVGNDDKNLAIAGRYNQLAVWNWAADKLYRVSYPRLGGQEDYITSLATNEQRPGLLATADNQGYITLWNIKNCTPKKTNGNTIQDVECPVLAEWPGHGGKAVRSVALSADGCYLVSSGDDSSVMLWPLTEAGNPATQKSQKIQQSSKKLNSVDVKVVNNEILTISGSDDTEVRLDRQPWLPQLGCDKGEK